MPFILDGTTVGYLHPRYGEIVVIPVPLLLSSASLCDSYSNSFKLWLVFLEGELLRIGIKRTNVCQQLESHFLLLVMLAILQKNV